jgi:hypothetical protein
VSEVLRRGAELLIPCGSSASVAAKRQTSTIPIVFPSVGDPIGMGLVESWSHPGGNATGFSDILADLRGLSRRMQPAKVARVSFSTITLIDRRRRAAEALPFSHFEQGGARAARMGSEPYGPSMSIFGGAFFLCAVNTTP